MSNSDEVISVNIKSESSDEKNAFEDNKFTLDTVTIKSINAASECIDKTRMSNESEKKSSDNGNKPPQLVPYCIDIDDFSRDEDSSSPPQLFPEGIVTTKMNRTLSEKPIDPEKKLISDTSNDQNKVKCIEISDSFDESINKRLSCTMKKRDKSRQFPFRHGKWHDFILDSKELKKSLMSKYKPKMKEREKLKKASERMMSPPRALANYKGSNKKHKIDTLIKKQSNVDLKKKEPFVMIVNDGSLTVSTHDKTLIREASNSLMKKLSPSLPIKENSFTAATISSSAKKEPFSSLQLSSSMKGNTVLPTTTTSFSSDFTVLPVQTKLSSKGCSSNNRSSMPTSSFNKGNTLNFGASPNGSSTNLLVDVNTQNDSVHITRTPVTTLKSFKAVDITIQRKPEIANMKRGHTAKINKVVDFVDIKREFPDKEKQIDHREVDFCRTTSVNSTPKACITSKEKNSNQNSIIIGGDGFETLFPSSVSKMSLLGNNIYKLKDSGKTDIVASLEGRKPKQTTNLALSSDDMTVSMSPVNEHSNDSKIFDVERSGSPGSVKCSNKIVFTFPKSTIVTDASGNEVSTIDIIEEKGDRELISYTKRKTNELSALCLDNEGLSLLPITEKKRKEYGHNIVSENITLELSDKADLDTLMSSVSSICNKNTDENNRFKNSSVTSTKQCENTQFIEIHTSSGNVNKCKNVSPVTFKLNSETENEVIKHIKVENEGTTPPSNSVSNCLEDMDFETIVKLENNYDEKKDAEGDTIITKFKKDMFMNQGDDDTRNKNSEEYLFPGQVNWPDFEDNEDDDDDEYFTLPQRVSTGKEERDLIDGIEFLSFETERDMVEFTKIQQDFWYGSALDDGMIPSDDGLDMMDDAFAVCGDMDVQYAHQAIVPTKTNDITKIKGWRNKQFAVNDNPSSYCGLNNEYFEDDDGFESCDVKIADDLNLEEQQQNHWFSENAHINEPMETCNYGDQREEEEEDEKLSSCIDSEKQKSNSLKDNVTLNSMPVLKTDSPELLKQLQSNLTDTKNTKSAFVSDILDNYLSSHSQLNISYEIPKLGAEEGITHHKELEVNQFPFPSPTKHSHKAQERSKTTKKVGPKAKTLAEKRKLLEQDFNRQQKIKIPQKKLKKMTSPELHISEEKGSKFKENRENTKPKSKSRSALLIKEQKNELKLDPDYKYTWVRGRPIRITGSKIFKELVSCEDHFVSNETEQHTSVPTKQDDTVKNISEPVKIKTEENIPKEKEQNCKESETNVLEKSLPVQPTLKDASEKSHSLKTNTCGIMVSPRVGCPLHPFAIKHLKDLRCNKYLIDSIWAKFAVSVVISSKEKINCVPEKHIIPINYTVQTLNQKTSESNFDSSHTIMKEKSESSLTENIDVLRNPTDEVQLEVKTILEDMIQSVINHEIQDTIMKDDPDALTNVSSIIPESPKKVKKRKNRVHRELNRLDVNVIVMKEEGNGFIKNQDGENLCGRDFCRLGCVCDSVQNCEPLSNFLDHCGKVQCMFECLCKNKESFKVNLKKLNDNSINEKPSLLLSTAMRLKDEENRHLAKVEKEFRQTVIQSKNQMIVVGRGSSGDGGRRKREIKLPERYRDSSVVLGKEFAIAEFKMITGDDLYSSPNVPNSLNAKRTERQLSLPQYVQVDVPVPPRPKPYQRLIKAKLTPEQKMTLLNERYKITPCKISVEKMKGLEDVVPWCMVHLKYNCFCSGQSVKPFKKMPHRPVQRPPPIPGPVLDNSAKKPITTTRVQKPPSRNVAVKSTTNLPNIHAHDVYRHSARTYGTTINYRIRNQSHYFQFKHKRIYTAHTEENLTSNQPFVPYSPDLYMSASIIQTLPVLASEESQENTCNDTEEFGFGKIVSITSLKPEEFEKCDNVNMDQDEQMQENNTTLNIVKEVENVDRETSSDINALIEAEDTTLVIPEVQKVSSLSHEVPTNLIPLLPEDCNDVCAMRLRELISTKEEDLKNLYQDGKELADLSENDSGSIQVIKWSCLLNQLKNKSLFLWLKCENESMPKFFLTKTCNKPDQNWILVNVDEESYEIDVWKKLPLSITYILNQICRNNDIPSTDHLPMKENTFGFLLFEGENWELVGLFLKECDSESNFQEMEKSIENVAEEPEIETNKSLPHSEENHTVSDLIACEILDNLSEFSKTETPTKNSEKLSKEDGTNLDKNIDLKDNIENEQENAIEPREDNDDVNFLINSEPVTYESLRDEDTVMIENSSLSNSVVEFNTNDEVCIDHKTNSDTTINAATIQSLTIVNGDSEIVLNNFASVNVTNIENGITSTESLSESVDNEEIKDTKSQTCEEEVKDDTVADLSVLSEKLNLQNKESFTNDSIETADWENLNTEITNLDTKESNFNQCDTSNLISKEIKDKSGMVANSVLCMTVTLPPDSETLLDKSMHEVETDTSIKTPEYVSNQSNNICNENKSSPTRKDENELDTAMDSEIRIPLFLPMDPKETVSKDENELDTATDSEIRIPLFLPMNPKETVSKDENELDTATDSEIRIPLFLPMNPKETVSKDENELDTATDSEIRIPLFLPVNPKETVSKDENELDAATDSEIRIPLFLPMNPKETVSKDENELDTATDSEIRIPMFLPKKTVNEVNEMFVQIDLSDSSKESSKINEDKDVIASADIEEKTDISDTPSENQNNQTLDIDVPLPCGKMPSRWFMLIIKYKFDLLFVANSLVRYAQIVRAVMLANNHHKTVRLPLDNPSKEMYDNQPKFGVYAVPKLFTRVFIGPYGFREEAGVSTLKIINGKLVNVMHRDLNETADIDDSIMSLMTRKEESLNQQMEEMCDKNAFSLSNNKMCRGMWLCSNIKNKKKTSSNSSKRENMSLDLDTNISSEIPEKIQDDEFENQKINSIKTDTNNSVIGNDASTQGDSAVGNSNSKEENNDVVIVGDSVYTQGNGTSEQENSDFGNINSKQKNNDILIFGDSIYAQENKDPLIVGYDTSKQENIAPTIDKNENSSQEQSVEVKKFTSRRKQIFAPRNDNIRIEEVKMMDSSLFSSLRKGKMDILDSDDEILDVETPCNTGMLFREARLRSIGTGMQIKKESSGGSSSQLFERFTSSYRGTHLCLLEFFSTSRKNVDNNPLRFAQSVSQQELIGAGQGLPVLSIGKKAISIKLVPSISTVGYVTASMYHNKTILLRNPFNQNSQPCFFQNVDTATRWLTDELRAKIDFVPYDLQLKWKIRHSTVEKLKKCDMFNPKILDGQHIITAGGVAVKRRDEAAHAMSERWRRKELIECFRKLGSSFLTQRQLKKTNKFGILKMAYKEIKKCERMNSELVSELTDLRKKRFNNFTEFCWRVRAIPSAEERKTVLNKLISIFQKETDQKKIFDFENVTREDTYKKLQPSTQPMEEVKDSSSRRQNNGRDDTEDDYLSDEKILEGGNVRTNTQDIKKEKSNDDDDEKPKSVVPLSLKSTRDESVSMSIFVVNGNDPSPAKPQLDKDVVTVTRIPHKCSCGNKICLSGCSGSNSNNSSSKSQNNLMRSSSVSNVFEIVRKKVNILGPNRRSSDSDTSNKIQNDQKDNSHFNKDVSRDSKEGAKDLLETLPQDSEGFMELSKLYEKFKEEESKQNEIVNLNESGSSDNLDITDISWSRSSSKRRNLSISFDDDEIRAYKLKKISEDSNKKRIPNLSQKSNRMKTSTPLRVRVISQTSGINTPFIISQAMSGKSSTSLPSVLNSLDVSQNFIGTEHHHNLSGTNTSTLQLCEVILEQLTSVTKIRPSGKTAIPVTLSRSSNGLKMSTSCTTPVISSSSLLPKFEFKRTLMGADGELNKPKIRLIHKVTCDGKSTFVPSLVNKTEKIGYRLLTNNGVIKPIISLANIGQLRTASQSENSPKVVKLLTPSGNVEVPLSAVTNSQQVGGNTMSEETRVCVGVKKYE
ncbi:hypothetical protein L9F63_000781, partial [Diploptera punctata]